MKNQKKRSRVDPMMLRERRALKSSLINIIHSATVGLLETRDRAIWGERDGVMGPIWLLLREAPSEDAVRLLRKIASLLAHRHEHGGLRLNAADAGIIHLLRDITSSGPRIPESK